jgi:dihydropteroate synthase
MTRRAESDGPGDGPETGGHRSGGEPLWRIGDRTLSLARPRVMGILNRTPDSFSDGGELDHPDALLRRAERHLEEGAAILDIGGESTRPGARPVSVEEEIRRTRPAVEAIRRHWDVPISIDTRHSEVARAALDAGATIVNDVSGLAHDPGLGEVIREFDAGAVLMHMRGTPRTMADHASYEDVVGEVVDELHGVVARAVEAGIRRSSIVIDPGIGFAKTAAQSWQLLRDLHHLSVLDLPILIGPSRKSFLGAALDLPPEERITATAVACALAVERGAGIVRVHDVRPAFEALQVVEAMRWADPRGGDGVNEKERDRERGQRRSVTASPQGGDR